MARDEFDVLVVGGGPAGEVVAGACAEGGLTVALVERELVGGECAYWACIPSKTLLRPGDVLATAARVPGAREAITGRIDAAAALHRRDEMTNEWNDASQVTWLDDARVTLVRGAARLDGERTLRVTSREGTTRTLHARRAVVLATGSSAAIPPIPGLHDARPWTSRDATSSKRVPKKLIILGGGVVGVEMAQAWRRLGAEQVIILEAGRRLVAREEPFAGDELASAFAAEGIEVLLQQNVKSVSRRSDGSIAARLESGRELIGEELLVATGRRANSKDLGLETVGLPPEGFVAVDDQLRAKAPGGWLYAVGDVNGRSLFTHMGKYQARQAAAHILGLATANALADHHAVPRVTFTDPQVAAVGHTEATARSLDVRTVRYPTYQVAGAAVMSARPLGQSQLIIDNGSDTIVGATFVGSEVGELVHSATVAIIGRVPIDRLWHAVPAFPTISEVWLRLLETDQKNRK